MNEHRSRAVPGLRVAPVTHAQANDYVTRHHRHNGKLPTSILRIGVIDGSGLVRGVAIAGLPKARMICDNATLEVNRVCTDGAYNACSMLYAACIRAAKALGYWRVITYTLDAETGASLRASGWVAASQSDGGAWDRPNQPGRRGQKDEHDLGAKWRWEQVVATKPPALIWPDASDLQDALLDFGAVS